MLLAHAIALVQARTWLAALADQARTTSGSSAYEHALVHLDWIHGDNIPAIDPATHTGAPESLFGLATAAIEALIPHGADALQVELLLAMLDDAGELDSR